MKISNETKIGALTIIAIVFLFLGFNFLKGKSLFKTGFYLYAKFPESKGLVPSNTVSINGFQAGTISKVSASKNLKEILVEIKLDQPYDIPDNSIADISSNPLGASSLEIALGKSKVFLKSNDTIPTLLSPGLFGMMGSQLKPLTDQAKETMQRIDTLMQNINYVLDSNSKLHLQQVMANFSVVTQNLIQTTKALNELLNLQTGALAGTLNNVNSFTKNLAANNGKVDSMMTNLQLTTAKFSKVDIEGAVNQLKSSAENLNKILSKVNSTDGSLGALINNKDLYNNINSTTNSLHTLLDDLRVHPKRYVNISVFGKKDKGDYLERPLIQDSLASSPQK